mmetsp:Transcript_8886/g.10155  ORF Transcript_8886/g.10155 Transcript_8886/m.10155 type:complete len:102 (-) Transcript_8886:1656-1961(-)
MASAQVLMAIIYAPLHMILSALSLYMFKSFLLVLESVSNNRFPQDYTLLRHMQPYIRELNTLLEDQLLGPASKMKINLTHVLLASILISLLSMVLSRARQL